MPIVENKYDHVRRAEQTRAHTCHWPGCNKTVKPALWGCKRHWFALPLAIRNEIWRTYRAGQESDRNVSPEYLAAVRAAEVWVKQRGDAKQGKLI